MPLLTTLNPFVIKGYAYRLKYLGFDRTTTYHRITNLTGLSMFDAKCASLVTEVFESGPDSLKFNRHLKLSEKDVYNTPETVTFIRSLNHIQRISVDQAELLFREMMRPTCRFTILRIYSGVDDMIPPTRNHDWASLLGVLISLRIEGFLFKDAFFELIRMFPEGIVWNMYKVHQIFKSFERGECLQQKTQEHQKITNLPMNVLSKIMNFLDLPSTIRFKNTCKSFRKRVDAGKTFRLLLINIDKNGITFSTWRGVLAKWIYMIHGYIENIDGCTVYKDNDDPCGMEKAAKKYLNWLLSVPSLAIKTFHYCEELRAGYGIMNLPHGYETSNLYLWKGIKNLKVENVHLETEFSINAARTLQALDPQYLQYIRYTNDVSFSERFESDITTKTRQWAQASIFETSCTITAEPETIYECFKHFECCMFRVKTLPEMVVKNMIRYIYDNLPYFRSRIIYYDPCDVKQTYPTLPINSPAHLAYDYPPPNTHKTLFVSVRETHIAFFGPSFIFGELPDLGYLPREISRKLQRQHKLRVIPLADNVVDDDDDDDEIQIIGEVRPDHSDGDDDDIEIIEEVQGDASDSDDDIEIIGEVRAPLSCIPCDYCKWLSVSEKPFVDMTYPGKFQWKDFKLLKELVCHNYELREIRIKCHIAPLDLDEINRNLEIVNERTCRQICFGRSACSAPKLYFLFSVIQHQVWFIGPKYIPGELNLNGLTREQQGNFAAFYQSYSVFRHEP